MGTVLTEAAVPRSIRLSALGAAVWLPPETALAHGGEEVMLVAIDGFLLLVGASALVLTPWKQQWARLLLPCLLVSLVVLMWLSPLRGRFLYDYWLLALAMSPLPVALTSAIGLAAFGVRRGAGSNCERKE
jgi:hypothetical protein